MNHTIVCDTGPLLHLNEAGAIHLLSLAGNILVPQVVMTEFEANALSWKLPQWIKVTELEKKYSAQAAKWIRANQIDGGEAEAIGLALQVKSDWLLTDDAQARKFAESLGLEVHGSVGLLLWNVAVGNVENKTEALSLLKNLVNSSLWVSDRVVQKVHKAINLLFQEE